MKARKAELVGFVELLHGLGLDYALELLHVSYAGQLPDVHLFIVCFLCYWSFPLLADWPTTPSRETVLENKYIYK